MPPDQLTILVVILIFKMCGSAPCGTYNSAAIGIHLVVEHEWGTRFFRVFGGYLSILFSFCGACSHSNTLMWFSPPVLMSGQNNQCFGLWKYVWYQCRNQVLTFTDGRSAPEDEIYFISLPSSVHPNPSLARSTYQRLPAPTLCYANQLRSGKDTQPVWLSPKCPCGTKTKLFTLLNVLQ